jgi:hypothetical protein
MLQRHLQEQTQLDDEFELAKVNILAWRDDLLALQD